MLDFLKHWLTVPPVQPGEYTAQDDRVLEHDNAHVLANLETEKRLQDRPRCRFSFWFFFF